MVLFYKSDLVYILTKLQLVVQLGQIACSAGQVIKTTGNRNYDFLIQHTSPQKSHIVSSVSGKVGTVNPSIYVPLNRAYPVPKVRGVKGILKEDEKKPLC